MNGLKRIFKRNTHNALFRSLAGFGRSLNRLYENRNHDIYSNGELTVLKKISGTDPSVIIDAGANVGDYSLMVNKIAPECKIFALEPVEQTFKKLVTNTNGKKNIIPVRKGLYNSNCSMEINLYPSDEHSSIFELEGTGIKPGGRQIIELVKGDDFIKQNQISVVDLLKLDVEGAEYDALTGFGESIEKGIIKTIQFEYGYINITTKRLLIDYYRYFEKKGYVVGKIFPKNVEFRKYSFIHEDFIGPNFIAVKESEHRLISLLSGRK